MTKTSVKFTKDRHKTVGGVAHTRYLLLEVGQNHGTMYPRKAEYYMYIPSLFFEKVGDNNCDSPPGQVDRLKANKLLCHYTGIIQEKCNRQYRSFTGSFSFYTVNSSLSMHFSSHYNLTEILMTYKNNLWSIAGTSYPK